MGSGKGGSSCASESSSSCSVVSKPDPCASEMVSHGTWSMAAQVNLGCTTVGITLQFDRPPSGSITLTFSSGGTTASTSYEPQQQKSLHWM